MVVFPAYADSAFRRPSSPIWNLEVHTASEVSLKDVLIDKGILDFLQIIRKDEQSEAKSVCCLNLGTVVFKINLPKDWQYMRIAI